MLYTMPRPGRRPRPEQPPNITERPHSGQIGQPPQYTGGRLGWPGLTTGQSRTKLAIPSVFRAASANSQNGLPDKDSLQPGPWMGMAASPTVYQYAPASPRRMIFRHFPIDRHLIGIAPRTTLGHVVLVETPSQNTGEYNGPLEH